MIDPVIEIIRQLAANPKAGPELVARKIGNRFVRDEASSNRAFDIYSSTVPFGEGRIKGLEMRVKRADGFVRLYVMTVETKGYCLKEDAVKSAFGNRFEFAPPVPHHTGQAPSYYSYAFPDHKISFGYETSRPTCFSRVVVEFP